MSRNVQRPFTTVSYNSSTVYYLGDMFKFGAYFAMFMYGVGWVPGGTDRLPPDSQPCCVRISETVAVLKKLSIQVDSFLICSTFN